MYSTDEIRSEIRGRLGVITLNRPKALNALSFAMVRRMDAILAEWRSDPAVDAVLLRGTGRAFCAGGDVRAIGSLPDATAREDAGRAFFRFEYGNNHRIHTYPKPVIALAAGVVMGGGMGLAVHSSHCVVTETTMMAMPETVLGLFPDVGAMWFLSRCPGSVGRYLGLTGARLGAADALWSGLASSFVPSDRLDSLVDDLARRRALDHASVDASIAAYADSAPSGTLAERAGEIDRAFAGERLEPILLALGAAPDAGWQAEALAVLRRASPFSLRATWQRLMAAAGQSIETVLSDDYRMGTRIVARNDFAEGVRAILIDKDNAPHWTPATLADVDDAEIDALLAPLADDAGGDLTLSLRSLR